MNKEIIFLVEEAPEGGYTARALTHSISSIGLHHRASQVTSTSSARAQVPRSVRLPTAISLW